MATLTSPSAPLRFGDWEVRTVERELIVRGVRAHIGSRAFDVLLALVQRRGNVVTKNELLDAAWHGLVVEENNVSVQIAALRKVIGARAIATVAGLGYQLTVTSDPDAPGQPAPTVDALRPGSQLTAASIDLIGRDTEVEELAVHVATLGLVSIVGTGGVGKTSLAKAIVAKTAHTFHDDVHWIDLAPLREPGQVVPLLARSVGVELGSGSRAREDLLSALSQARLLIAIDNCEHLVSEIAAFVSDALAHAPGVRWLSTSQEPLHVAGELVYRLRPLALPGDSSSLEEALANGAVALLCRRSSAADRHFELNESNVEVAVQLCRQLDGLPLAIEMAASRVASLGLQGLYEQLGSRLRLLAGPRGGPSRHHTLRGTFDWSYGLLNDVEQRVFRRLEPFLGGFELSMAQRLTCDPEGAPGAVDEWQALEALDSLIDKSLVHPSSADPHRFFLMESARDYAREQLAQANEAEPWRRRHACVVADALRAAQVDFVRFSDAEWTSRYVPERHNARAALGWACAADAPPDLLAVLAAGLAQIDSFVLQQAEILRCDVPMGVLAQATPALRAIAYLEISWSHYAEGSREKGTELALLALRDFDALGDETGQFRALSQLVRLYESRPGTREKANEALQRLRALDSSRVPLRTRLSATVTAGLQHEGARTVRRLRELEEIAHRAGYSALGSICRLQATDVLLIEGRFEEAIVAAQRSLQDGETRPRVKGLLLINQALALVQLGKGGEAAVPARAALRILPSSAYVVADTFALAAVREGRHTDAALMAGYGARVRRERDENPDPAEASVIGETDTRLREALPVDRLAELTQVGAGMSTPDVMAIALRS